MEVFPSYNKMKGFIFKNYDKQQVSRRTYSEEGRLRAVRKTFLGFGIEESGRWVIISWYAHSSLSVS